MEVIGYNKSQHLAEYTCLDSEGLSDEVKQHRGSAKPHLAQDPHYRLAQLKSSISGGQ